MSWARSVGVRVFVAGMALLGCVCFALAFSHWQSTDPVKFTCYLIAALLAASLKVSLPGIEGTLSVNFLFTLLGILELSLPETLVIGLASTLAQFYWKPVRRVKLIQLVFNLSQVAVSSAAAYGSYQFVVAHVLHAPGSLALLVAAIVHFTCNTAATSIIIGLTENKPVAKVWGDNHLWLFPYYMVGAAAAGLVHLLNRQIGWQSSLLVLPPIYLLYRSYRLYLGKLEGEKQHAERLSNLHLQTIEALALAIEAKDRTTGEHLQRVRVYAMELAKELGLSEDETEALRAASVLHDIGKLAVPEHIISKPGKLTPEEFEKMKIHPIVGAEILEQVNFPYPVVPIVRAHHEKWDGSGYPYGLAGEAIPIGARILSAVDCLDAMATDRQYRKALPISQAMDVVVQESGRSYDPRIVSILARRYLELEKMAKAEPLQAPPKLSTDIKVERGLAPGIGFAEAAAPAVSAPGTAADPVSLVSHARRQGEEILELTKQIGASVTVEDTLALLASRLKRLISHDSMAVFFPNNSILLPEFVSGDNFRLISSLRIPLGKGLVGWVAQNRKSILNGNPLVEPGYAIDPAKHTLLGSALAVPLGAPAGTPAVLVLYRVGEHAFTDGELTVAEAFADGLGLAMQSPAQSQAKPKAASAGAK